MSQASISTFFIARKRGLEDDVISNKNKKKVCLERARNGSESQTDTEDVGATVVFSKASDYHSSTDDEPKILVKKNAVRQGVTPQRALRSKTKKIHMQEVDGIETPKMMTFFKGGYLSPQKKAKRIPVIHPETKSAEVVQVTGHSTSDKPPTTADNVEKTPLVPSNGLKLGEAKKMTKGRISSSSLTELKTSLNKFQSSLDKLKQMESNREKSNEASKALKPFKKIELEIMSPTKRLSSPLKLKDSPMKNSLMGSPKQLTPKRLFSPIKSSLEMSPVKAPAYQRFQSLAEAGTPTLQLPFKYRYLLELFRAVDTVSAMFFNRKEKITFKKLKPAVQRMVRKNFLEPHLAQIQKLMPNAYKFAQEKTRNFGSTSKADYYQLVITPNLGSPSDDVKELTMSPQILIERTKLMTKQLLDLVYAEHEKFLQTLEVPINVTRGALKRWHEEFDLEKVPDVEQGELPQPPNIEKFSSAKVILSTARNLFNCSTPMERALERFEQAKLQEKPKQVQSQQLQCEKMIATPAHGADAANDERKKAAEPNTTLNSVLKGVPQALLDKIRARQAAKALDTMTRRPSQEREAAKYARLPDIAHHAFNIYMTEKGTLKLEMMLKKIKYSYGGNVTMKEIEELLRMIAELEPTFISFIKLSGHEMRVKVNRDCKINDVMDKLKKLSAEKSKI